MKNTTRLNFFGWCLFVLFVGFIFFAYTVEYRLNRLEHPVTSDIVTSNAISEDDLIAQGWSKECMSYNEYGDCVRYIFVRWNDG
jgi:hypothetical protein